MKPDDKVRRLLASALAVESMTLGGFRKEADLTPAERERAKRWHRWARQKRPADRNPF
jgi:hypothetical protein